MFEIKSRSNAIFQFVVSTLFIIIAILALIPILHVFSISLSGKNDILSGRVSIFPVNPTSDAYRRVFTNSNFMNSFVYSIFLTLLSTGVNIVMTILAAYPLSKRKLKGGRFIFTLFILTMYFNPGIIPTYLNIRDLQLLDKVWALILPGALSAYNMIILRNAFLSIDDSLYEAAEIDGASHFRSLLVIVLPLTIPTIATLSLFYAVGRWNGVTDVLYYINSPRLYTVQMQLKQMIDSIAISREEGRTTEIVAENIKSASIIISMLPMLVAYPFIQRYFTEGIMLGAVKG